MTPQVRFSRQAKPAVESRAFPLLFHGLRTRRKIRERVSLVGNPGATDDRYKVPKTGEVIDFLAFARMEGRSAKQCEQDGRPSEAILDAKADRLQDRRLLHGLAGSR